MADPKVNDLTVTILREALDSAADRIASRQANPTPPPGGCPVCGRKARVFTAGHLYAILLGAFFFLVVLVGAMGR